MNAYAVIMAGGVGSRFWPKSREKNPKQLLKIFSENSMIQETVLRLNGIMKKENIFIITNNAQREGIIEQLSNIPVENIIAEPFGKNTAACIGLAAVIIKSKCENAIMITLPADHLIKDVSIFQQTIKDAIEFAEQNQRLVTIGINPTRPETGYGYIQIEESPIEDSIFKVLRFAEKPNLETAERFLESGDFFWNSGMFIWSVDTIMKEFNQHMPDLVEGLDNIYNAINKPEYNDVLFNAYGQFKSISIDYGIMEKSQNVYLIKGNFDWNDVGSWEAVYQLAEKDEDENASEGEVFYESTKGSFISTKKKFTAVLGVENLIVIETEDALLICDRNKAQDVKVVVDHLKLNKKTELT
ncbi:MAG: NTP transferase domain-containing protein [Bacteroidetes bacterium]|nr:NTP transferase domain-containing protein [Bacteroidota bacterium]MBU2508224.1 NTP transferase domain-containing protein [Bacteroidota bacterium]